jgi:hypothetical protein
MDKLPVATTSLLTIIYTLASAATQAQNKIGIVDIYGNRTIPDSTIRKQIKLKAGDTLAPEDFQTGRIINRVRVLRGVQTAQLDMVCCDDKTGGRILYVGIAEDTGNSFTYYKAPVANIKLPAVITQTNDAYMNAMEQAVRQGRSSEDHNTGYALLHDTVARTEQLKFVTYAKQYAEQLKAVLHQSADAQQRAIATMVIAYGPDKKAFTSEMLYAIYDPNESVRNNATRALWVLTDYLQAHPEEKITIPAAPFVKMINSVVWTDRNKGSLLLFALTQERDPALLATLKKEAFTSLCQMARWKNTGHALQAYLIIARISGVPDGDAFTALMADNRNAFLESMIERIQRSKE